MAFDWGQGHHRQWRGSLRGGGGGSRNAQFSHIGQSRQSEAGHRAEGDKGYEEFLVDDAADHGAGRERADADAEFATEVDFRLLCGREGFRVEPVDESADPVLFGLRLARGVIRVGAEFRSCSACPRRSRRGRARGGQRTGLGRQPLHACAFVAPPAELCAGVLGEKLRVAQPRPPIGCVHSSKTKAEANLPDPIDVLRGDEYLDASFDQFAPLTFAVDACVGDGSKGFLDYGPRARPHGAVYPEADAAVSPRGGPD